jgi:hypothetical protein
MKIEIDDALARAVDNISAITRENSNDGTWTSDRFYADMVGDTVIDVADAIADDRLRRRLHELAPESATMSLAAMSDLKCSLCPAKEYCEKLGPKSRRAKVDDAGEPPAAA